MSGPFEPADEFVCPSCGVPASQLPEGHEMSLDLDALVCTSGVLPLLREGYAWGGGGPGSNEDLPVVRPPDSGAGEVS